MNFHCLHQLITGNWNFESQLFHCIEPATIPLWGIADATIKLLCHVGSPDITKSALG